VSRRGPGSPFTILQSAVEGGTARTSAHVQDWHNAPMSKPRVTFKLKRVAEGDWQIEAHYPGAEIRYIRGFKTKAEIDEWLAGSRRIDWLRSQGYAK
jgi:hypothetical protein